MGQLAIAILDAFSDQPFSGNPAGVCLLENSISQALMQQIAMEMNLSETAFVERTSDPRIFSLRWFTPAVEVDLCGHATLASASWMFHEGWVKPEDTIHFQTRSGILSVTKNGEGVGMDFPLIPTEVDTHPNHARTLFGAVLVQAARLRGNWIFELEDEVVVRNLVPDFAVLAATSEEGFIVTAAGSSEYDLVSRYFGPNLGINEDPVTGFAHCALVDYWYKKTGKTSFKAYQASKRGGLYFWKKKEIGS
ncbi:MAG: PhzF family phenazine biosynthesis protein [Algoriphagus sp.]|nr:PhzF family phenazine biosynthesis protein [Algoriphagus sp.]